MTNDCKPAEYEVVLRQWLLFETVVHVTTASAKEARELAKGEVSSDWGRTGRARPISIAAVTRRKNEPSDAD